MIPVLVGVGVASQRFDDPKEALEPVALMADALQRAIDDTGNRGVDRLYSPSLCQPVARRGLGALLRTDNFLVLNQCRIQTVQNALFEKWNVAEPRTVMSVPLCERRSRKCERQRLPLQREQ